MVEQLLQFHLIFHVKKIAISSKHLLGLINDILDMSKIESGKMTLNIEQISLREILNGIATILNMLLIINITSSNSRHTYYSIHWRTNIMTHI